MPRVCTICSSERRDDIEDAFIAGTAKRRIATQFGVGEKAVRHHMREHFPALLALARDADRAARADTLLDRIEALQAETRAVLEEVKGSENYGVRLGAIREMRHNLELIGEVTKELNRTPTLNLSINPQWIELRTLILGALEPHLDARESVVRALEGASNGRG